MRKGGCCGFDYVAVGVAQYPIRDIVADGRVEEQGLLRHDADSGPKCSEADLFQVNPVDHDHARGRIEKARDQVDEGRLAGPTAADQGQNLTRMDREGDVPEHLDRNTFIVK